MIKGAFEKAKEYVESRSRESNQIVKPGPCITISRETGAGADVVSILLAEYLEKFNISSVKWTIFYKNLIEKVLNDHNLPATIKDLMQEQKYSHINNLFQELITGTGHYSLEHKTVQTILQLAGMGNVIIVGRGSSIITAKLEKSFHVRLVAPFEKRVKHVQEVYGIKDKNEAAEFTRTEDEARKKYIKTQFHKDISDDQLYHLVINTGYISYDKAAVLIGDTVLKMFG